jgi:hypothetical protein
MADEKRNQVIVEKNELSDDELEQATGGVAAAVSLDRAELDRAASRETSRHRK